MHVNMHNSLILEADVLLWEHYGHIFKDLTNFKHSQNIASFLFQNVNEKGQNMSKNSVGSRIKIAEYCWHLGIA